MMSTWSGSMESNTNLNQWHNFIHDLWIASLLNENKTLKAIIHNDPQQERNHRRRPMAGQGLS